VFCGPKTGHYKGTGRIRALQLGNYGTCKNFFFFFLQPSLGLHSPKKSRSFSPQTGPVCSHDGSVCIIYLNYNLHGNITLPSWSMWYFLFWITCQKESRFSLQLYVERYFPSGENVLAVMAAPWAWIICKYLRETFQRYNQCNCQLKNVQWKRNMKFAIE